MKNKKIILFDMDGTINDSAEGIINGITYTLNLHGIMDIEREEVKKYIGPSFRQTLTEVFGFSTQKAAEVHDVMRQFMMEKGMYQNKVYEGIPSLLKQLKEAGKIVGLATAKWADQAEAILHHFDLYQYFDCVGGVCEKITGKSEVIRKVLDTLGVKNKTEAVMVGDRSNDVLGAKENGIECIGVLYGYGTREELDGAGVTCITESVESLKKLLL